MSQPSPEDRPFKALSPSLSRHLVVSYCGDKKGRGICHTPLALNFSLSVWTAFYGEDESFARERERHRKTKGVRETGTDGDRVEGHRGEREAAKDRGTMRTMEQEARK